jgi:hypothetical protein
MRYRRHLSGIILAALLFLIIGSGNLIMGYRKGLYFEEAVEALHRKRVEMGTLDPVLLERLESKQSFYHIVSLGGLGLLSVSGILVALEIVRSRRW